MWWKQHKWKILAPALVLALLAGAFWYGGDAPGLRGWRLDSGSQAAPPVPAPSERPDASPVSGAEAPPEGAPLQKTPEEPASPGGERTEPAEEGAPQTAPPPGAPASEEAPEVPPEEAPPGYVPAQPGQGADTAPAAGEDEYRTDPVSAGKPVPVEPQDAEVTDVPHTCTLSVRCDTILNNPDWLDPEKLELVPEDGVLFPETAVTFYEGESVFHVLLREMRKAGIHLEFTDVPMYNSAYIEGIGNLYEFDCGQLSGWMYSVNGWYPNYGCSRYQLREGDVIEWRYTCDLGGDIGGSNALE